MALGRRATTSFLYNMKRLFSHLIVLSAGLATTATAGDARIHTFDLKPESSSLTSERELSPDGAVSLLKRRFGWSETASPLPDRIDEETVRNLNELGGQHTVPFGEAASSDTLGQIRRLLVILEGVNTEDGRFAHTVLEM